jgi:hypothetical protein
VHPNAEPDRLTAALGYGPLINSRIVEPGAIFVFLMGVGLIVTRGLNPLENLWLAVAIVLFLVTIGYSMLVQVPTVRKMIAMTSQPPPPPAPGEAPAGPPPEFVALSTRAQRGGMFLTANMFVILALMIVKPF